VVEILKKNLYTKIIKIISNTICKNVLQAKWDEIEYFINVLLLLIVPNNMLKQLEII